MIGKRLAHYEIQGHLGAGGMGEVYRARDTRLDRDVALKVLPPGMADDPDRRQRFEREAKAIAALNHPNIVTVYSVESSEGTHFLTMELVEGRTLGSLIAEGPLPLRRLFQIAIPLAEAVGAAHAKGITHRDLKPANVMIDGDGRLKVLDFGLAKLQPQSAGADAATVTVAAPHTEEGRILGTLAYMSPEQAEGKSVDHRSDIFSLGVILYEMATGARPFLGDTTASTLAAILRDTPRPVVALREDLPRQLDRIIQRCLDKDPARRFQSAADVRLEIENLQTETDSGTERPAAETAPPQPGTASPPAPEPTTSFWLRVRRARLPRLLAIYIAVAAGVLAIADLLTVHVGLPSWFVPGAALLLGVGLPVLVATAIAQSRTRVRHWLSWRKAITGGFVALAAWGVIVTGYLFMRARGIGPAASLVSAGVLEERSRVLIADFENHTDDPLLGQTVKEAFSVDLSQSPVVSVVGASLASRMLQRMGLEPDAPLDESTAREAALRDGVPVVVAGRVDAAGSGYVLSARLLEAKSGEPLTAIRETAETDANLIGAIDALSQALRERIGESLRSTRQSVPLAQVTTRSLDALQKYTLATQLADAGREPDRAIALLQDAVDIDSTFAMAHRKLGVLLNNLDLDPLRARHALTRAYRHRDRLTERERHLTAAMYFDAVTFEKEKAISAYEQVLAADPDDEWALNNLGTIYQWRGELEKALPLLERATALDTSAINLRNLGLVQIRTGRLDELRRTIERCRHLFGEEASLLTGVLASIRGDYATVEQILERTRDRYDPGSIERARATRSLSLAGATRGKLAASRRLHAEVLAYYETRGDRLTYLQIACELAELHAALGDAERARTILNEALARHDIASLADWEVPRSALASCYAALGETASAHEHLAGYRRQMDDGQRIRDAYVHGLEGLIALAEDRDDEALVHLERWMNEDAGPLTAFFWIGETRDRLAQPDSARASYERYISTRSPGRVHSDARHRARTLVRLGELYEEAGNRERAAGYYRAFMELWKDADPELRARVRSIRGRLERLSANG